MSEWKVPDLCPHYSESSTFFHSEYTRGRKDQRGLKKLDNRYPIEKENVGGSGRTAGLLKTLNVFVSVTPALSGPFWGPDKMFSQ